MRNRKPKLIAALLCLCLLAACGGEKETAAERPVPVETSAVETPAPDTPELNEPLVVSTQEEIKTELKAAMEQLRQPRVMALSGLELENPEIDVKNIYYGITAEAPELKYACDLTAWTEGTALHCQISFMPYKTGDFPADFSGLEIGSLQELISAAEEQLGNEPVSVRITDPNLDPDTMNRALQQAGGGYLYCGLNKDATAIVCSAPYNMSMEDCLAALAQADALASDIVSRLVTGGMSDLEKAEALYSYVTANVEYDQRYYSDRNAMPYESQTAVGALRDGVAICGGYSHAVKLLFEKAGIPCYNVTGTCQGENHMWNIARIDGQWLWFDATMDRGSTGEYGFLRFALAELDKSKYQWNEDTLAALLDS
ncbi:MAG: transglutaminase domain-containing protein [Candidatus Limivicinus sp.]